MAFITFPKGLGFGLVLEFWVGLVGLPRALVLSRTGVRHEA